tara:strand:+ start:870 stop:2099 length:1230 start_codon:yes stop_codon:yes gene_type:complete
MSDSHISDDWWLLLKDYTFPNNFSDEYLTSITTRLGQMKAGQLNEKVNIGRGDQSHYSQRKTERYKPNQKINHKGFGKHTPEEVATLMANDLLNTHPELLEAMHKEIPAPDPKHGETTPSMQFHLFNTDEPVTDSQYGPIRQFNPIFALGEDGKVGLKTVFGGQRPAASDRHTIRVTPTTSPAPGHMNSHIHEDLPSRFEFRETEQPENLPAQVETSVEKKPQLHPRHAEMMSIYNLPDSFRLPALQNKNIDATEFNQWMADSKLASEPMDIAWRLLKRQTELGEFHPDFSSSYGPVTEYHGTMDMPGVMRTGIDPPAKKRSKRHYPVEMRQNIPEKVTYTSPDREAVEQFLQRRAQQLGIPKESTGIVGVRAAGLDEPVTQVESGFGGDDMLTHVRAGSIPRDRLVPM